MGQMSDLGTCIIFKIFFLLSKDFAEANDIITSLLEKKKA